MQRNARRLQRHSSHANLKLLCISTHFSKASLGRVGLLFFCSLPLVSVSFFRSPSPLTFAIFAIYTVHPPLSLCDATTIIFNRLNNPRYCTNHTQQTHHSKCLSLAATSSRSSLPSSSHLLVSSLSEAAARKYTHIQSFDRSMVTPGLPFATFALLLLTSPRLSLPLSLRLLPSNSDFWINVLLTILGYLPGIIHALYIIFKY